MHKFLETPAVGTLVQIQLFGCRQLLRWQPGFDFVFRQFRQPNLRGTFAIQLTSRASALRPWCE